MRSLFQLNVKKILLADDDQDDCLLFKNALADLSLPLKLTIVPDGVELMDMLNQENMPLPDVLFLDLYMPRKSGFECLTEIKNNPRLNQIFVIIFSSSYAPEVVEQLYKNGAQFYVRKPDNVAQFKKVIYHALHLRNSPAFPALTKTAVNLSF
ncbi:MAG: response regulator [Ferruginibacter sp.]